MDKAEISYIALFSSTRRAEKQKKRIIHRMEGENDGEKMRNPVEHQNRVPMTSCHAILPVMIHSRFFSLCLLFVALFVLPSPALQAQERSLNEELIYRVNLGRADDVKLLLERGADLKTTNDSGWNALNIASSRRDREAVRVVEVLVKAGAKINVRDEAGNYALLNAIRAGNEDVVRYLLDNGADFFVRDNEGQYALAVAEKAGNTRIIGMLNKAIEDHSNRLKMERSVLYRNRLIVEYAFLNCTRQYISYCEQTGVPLKLDDYASKNQKDARLKRAGQITQILQTNFGFTPDILTVMAKSAGESIFIELDNLISTRNRIVRGVGKRDDMKNRCMKIANASLQNFEKAQQVYQDKERKRGY
jgi:hypothetical protein